LKRFDVEAIMGFAFDSQMPCQPVYGLGQRKAEDPDFALPVVEVDKARLAVPAGCDNPFLESIAGMPLRFAQVDRAAGLEMASEAGLQNREEFWVVDDI
jgi:hypothetical protein